MAFDVKQLLTYIIISLISVGCKSSSDLIVRAGTKLGGLAPGDSESSLASKDGDNSTVSEKRDNGKTSDEGEGVPGYLVDPSLVTLERTGDMMTAIALAGNIKSGMNPLGSLTLYIWTVERSVFISQTGDSWSAVSNAAILNQSVPISSDGSFNFSLNANGQVVILVIEKDPNISSLVIAPRRSENYNTYFVDFSDTGSVLRALPSSPDVMLVLAGQSCRKCNLRNAWLVGENLDNASLSGADLAGARFKGASLIDADLTGAILSQADFTEADLQTARLREAKAMGAKFVRANLRDSNLDSADLSGADLTGADLTNANTNNAILP